MRRAFSATRTYGGCRPVGEDGGCPFPAVVQLFPACRGDLAAPARRRGVPARVSEHGTQVELRTGGTRVLVATTSVGRTRAAVRALRSAEVAPGAPLPLPGATPPRC